MEPLSLPENQSLPRPVSRPGTEHNPIRETVARFLSNWYWFVLSALVCGGLAKLYLRYSVPMYKIECRILLKKQNPSNPQGEIMSQLEGTDNDNDLQNEIEVLTTRFLMKRVVRDLQLNTGIYSKGNIKATELYHNAPFNIHLIGNYDSVSAQSWKISLDPKTGQPFLEDAGGKTALNWGDTVRGKNAAFTITLRPGAIFPTDGTYYWVNLMSDDDAAQAYLGRLTAIPASDGANIVKMSMVDPIPERGRDILNDLYLVYVRANIEDQNRLADNTIGFIDSRLDIVSQELSGVEQHIEEFKSSNNLVDLTQQSQLVTVNANELDKEIAQANAQLEVVGAIEAQLQKAGDYQTLPGSLVTQSSAYASLVEKFNNLALQRSALLETSKESNPVVQELNDRINEVRGQLLPALEDVKREITINRDNLSNRLEGTMGEIRRIPSKQRAFLDISRQQEVKQQLYLFLLQKREETAISKSGTLSKSRLIDPARPESVPFSPNRMNIYLVSLAIGLLVPAAVIYLRELLNNKVSEQKDIVSQTEVPILGEIGHSHSGDSIIVTDKARHMIAEQFRSIRTNLNFILTGKQHQVILLTSSMSGEGKSFVSLNLASSLAISGKKVVLLELDLRKPKLSSSLGLSNDQGFTNFIVSNTDLKYLPKPVAGLPNLFLIGSGPIPPNPAELLMQDKVKTLFEYLHTNFDYIVIDTPPVGLVSDALLVAGYADACLYIVRRNYTFKQQVGIADDLFTKRKVKNLSIIINDVDAQRRYGYGYRYGYSYGHNSYYSENGEKKGRLSKLFNPKS